MQLKDNSDPEVREGQVIGDHRPEHRDDR